MKFEEELDNLDVKKLNEPEWQDIDLHLSRPVSARAGFEFVRLVTDGRLNWSYRLRIGIHLNHKDVSSLIYVPRCLIKLVKSGSGLSCKKVSLFDLDDINSFISPRGWEPERGNFDRVSEMNVFNLVHCGEIGSHSSNDYLQSEQKIDKLLNDPCYRTNARLYSQVLLKSCKGWNDYKLETKNRYTSISERLHLLTDSLIERYAKEMQVIL